MQEILIYDVPENIKWLITSFEFNNFLFDKSKYSTFLPRADMSMIFHFGDTPSVYSNVQKKFINLSNFLIVPIVSFKIPIKLGMNSISFIAICRPTVLTRIFNMDLSNLTDIFISTPKLHFYDLLEDMRNEPDIHNRIKILSDFINNSFPNPYIPDEIDEIYENILNSPRDCSVKSIISKYDKSLRTIERKFIKRTGISVKTFIRIVRFNKIWENLNNSQKKSYQDIVYESNFFDQNHFIKELKKISGFTPKELFNNKVDIFRENKAYLK